MPMSPRSGSTPAPTRTAFDADRWAAGPTGFDVLRESLENALWQGSTVDDVLVRFALARAGMVPPAQVAWQIAWPTQARRLASPQPVAPTGASYVVIDRAGAPPGSKALLAHQDALRPGDLIGYAADLGLDPGRFARDLRTHAYASHVAEDVDTADLATVSGTPTFFINGQRHHGPYDIDSLEQAVRTARAVAAITSAPAARG